MAGKHVDFLHITIQNRAGYGDWNKTASLLERRKAAFQVEKISEAIR
jgi:hypothetical protein